MFGAALIQNGAAVDVGFKPEGDAAGEIGIDRAVDNYAFQRERCLFNASRST